LTDAKKLLRGKMPIYDNVQIMSYYPNPEINARKLFEGIEFNSILDVGAGHGGVFDLDFWQKNNSERREACDIHWIRDLPKEWNFKLGVDVTKLSDHYKENEFDFWQCL